MAQQPSREALRQRIATLEAALEKHQREKAPDGDGQPFSGEREELERKLSMATHALETSDARYRDLFENAGDAIFIHDLEGTILKPINEVRRREC